MPKTKCFALDEKFEIKFKKNPNYGTRKPAEILYWGKLKLKIVQKQKEAILTDWKCNEKKKGKFPEFEDVNKAP